MDVPFTALKRMLEAGQRYLAGKSSIHELNGAAMICLGEAVLLKAHPAIQEVAKDWVDMIDRCWNEWGHRADPIAEPEFREWLRTQLILRGASPDEGGEEGASRGKIS